MGNGIGKVCLCSAGAGDISGRFDHAAFLSNQSDKALGNSICYIRPDPCRFSDVFSNDDATQMTFRSISGASVSANSSTPLSTSVADSLLHSCVLNSSASFESSGSFTSMPPLQQHAPRAFSVGGSSGAVSGLVERGFSSGPVVGGFVSSPFDPGLNAKGSEPMELQRSFSHNGYGFRSRPRKRNLKKILQRVVLRTISLGNRSTKGVVSIGGCRSNENANAREGSSSTHLSGDLGLNDVEDDNYLDDDGGSGGGDGDGGGSDPLMGYQNQNLHWAQGRAGEDRVHIVISEDHGWVYVGIYDGFNGPDATDYLLNNLFCAVHDELKGILCNHKSESMATSGMAKYGSLMSTDSLKPEEKVLCLVKKRNDEFQAGNGMVDGCSSSFNKENCPIGNEKLNLDSISNEVLGMNCRSSNEEVRKKWEGRETGWKSEGNSEKVGIEKRMQANLSHTESKSAAAFTHNDVLHALSEALRRTEDAFLKTADEMITTNPVLAMMGSCVLVVLMKGEDVYLMNVGDSRAVLATHSLNSLQLTMEHSTHVKEEVRRIWREHPDDPSAVTKGRVKGHLNVTRAFGAGFLKQPKQNNAVLETFKVNYIGDSPYITCSPSLRHHRLSRRDRFLMLSSDGLYQYFTNEEAVAKVDSFITIFPDRDPAQLLIEEALCRAARKAGMDFRELLDIPQGERRLYHDDISIVIISLEGKIWRSSV